VRALLIVNPRATSAKTRDVTRVADELASELNLETAQTRYPSHARELAADAVADGFDLIIPLGGDGTLNEVVNGLMHSAIRSKPDVHAGAGSADPSTDVGPTTGGGPDQLPVIAPVPAGSANVFAQSFGYPPDPVKSARLIAGAARELAAGRASRTIGLGLAGDRYFTFSAGLGLDAEVIADVGRQRALGRNATPGRYLRTTVRRYYMATDRREPALTLYSDAGTPMSGLFLGVVTNSSPWTYLGRRPVSPVPRPDFSSGLDVFALRHLHTLTTLHALRQMMHTRDRAPQGRDVVTLESLCELTFRSRRPIAFQADGEYLGEVTEMAFRYVPNALRVLALRPPA
jgi:diacylglycerol kinase family enzyme